MNNDNKFWLGVWSIVAIAIVSTTAISTAHFERNHQDIIKMVQEGHSPIAAACALDDGLGNSPTCIILASKEAK